MNTPRHVRVFLMAKSSLPFCVDISKLFNSFELTYAIFFKMNFNF